MKACKITLHITACMSSFFLLLPQQAYTFAASDPQKGSVKRLERNEISDSEIQGIARQITVKILSDNNTIPIPSTGILIDKKSTKVGEQIIYLYLVIATHHTVQNRNAEYRVETADGRIYKAKVYSEYNSKFGDEIDLDLLYFSSPISYQKAELGDSSTLKNEEKVFVGGFACPESRFCEKESKFIFEPGTALLLKKPLVKYYQIAYTSNTKPGTSGGAVLNKKGKLVAINGQGKYASDDQYEYKDGSNPSREVIDFMRHFAWGIPINTYQQFSLQKPLDRVKLPDHAPVIEYVRSPNDTATDNDSTTQETWLNNTNVIIIVLVIVIVICGVIYAVHELRKTQIERRNQDREKGSQVPQTIQPNIQERQNIMNKLEEIINLSRKNSQLTQTNKQDILSIIDSKNSIIANELKEKDAQLLNKLSEVNCLLVSQDEKFNELFKKHFATLSDEIRQELIQDLYNQNQEIKKIYEYIIQNSSEDKTLLNQSTTMDDTAGFTFSQLASEDKKPLSSAQQDTNPENPASPTTDNGDTNH